VLAGPLSFKIDRYSSFARTPRLSINVENTVAYIIMPHIKLKIKQQYINVIVTSRLQKFIISETCLNRTSMGPTFMFRIDRRSVYRCTINKYFLL